jgi:hypothetical protein
MKECILYEESDVVKIENGEERRSFGLGLVCRSTMLRHQP